MKILTVRVVRHRSRLPRNVVDVSFLEVFKVRLNGASGNPDGRKVSLPQ